MGADIHLVIETKSKYGRGWIGVYNNGWKYPNTFAKYGNLDTVDGRNYQFFAVLAGVRGPGPDPLGLPEDASSMTLEYSDYWGADGHSHSFMSLRDFAKQRLLAEGKSVDLLREKISGEQDKLIKERIGFPIDDNEDLLDDYRVVFWFDN